MAVDREKALEMHRKAKGKICIYPTMNIRREEDISMAYVPGAVYPAQEILRDKSAVYDYTGKRNRLAVITDGSATLGLGNIGPEASLPVVEGKCLLFKQFGDVNAFPLCLASQNAEDIIHTALLIAPTVGAINIEDIASPNTFTVVRKLQKTLEIPVMCNDQHSSAVVVFAALSNSLKILGKKIEDLKIVVLGSGAAGIATTELLLYAGARDIVALNSSGILGPDNHKMNHIQQELSTRINKEGIKGGLEEAAKGADVIVGLSSSGKISPEIIKSMGKDPVIFALSRPNPEITPEEALKAGARIAASSLHDSINPLPNLHAYPGICRGLLDVRATGLNNNILIAAARAICSVVDRLRLSEDHIMPDLFSDEVTPRVAETVAQAAIAEGMATINVPKGRIYDKTWQRLFGGARARL
jgi:malate dehydrogenase (oxaloacetate-decarboxylating)